MAENKLEILDANYWENWKFAKDLQMFYPVDHPKRKALEKELNEMLTEINKIKNERSKNS